MRGSISSGPIFAGPEAGSIQQGAKEKPARTQWAQIAESLKQRMLVDRSFKASYRPRDNKGKAPTHEPHLNSRR